MKRSSDSLVLAEKMKELDENPQMKIPKQIKFPCLSAYNPVALNSWLLILNNEWPETSLFSAFPVIFFFLPDGESQMSVLKSVPVMYAVDTVEKHQKWFR